MSYYNSLAFNLRLQNLPEARVAEVLREVQDVCTQGGTDPLVEFGEPQHMASTYPKGPRRTSLGAKIAGPLLLLGLSLLVYRFLAQESGALHFLLIVALMIIAVVLGILVDRRLPAGFTAAKTP